MVLLWAQQHHWRSQKKLFGWATKINYNINTKLCYNKSIKHKIGHQKIKLYALKIQDDYLYISIDLKFW